MNEPTPKVHLIARPQLDWDAIGTYLESVGGGHWTASHDRDAGWDTQDLVEFAGKMCYRSWEPGLNPNVRKVREDQGAYLTNILASGHGSVLEHATYSFVFQDVSRVFTHEVVRHRPGTAVSQESLRFVRLDRIPVWLPDWAVEDEDLTRYARDVIAVLETFQLWMADHFGLDDESTPMWERKAKTSFMRRFAPEGVATSLVWTANIRTLRHVIRERTDHGAEEEIRLVFGQVAEIMLAECPLLFGDFEVTDGHWEPKWRKV